MIDKIPVPTGDEFPMMIAVALVLLSAAGLIAGIFIGIKKGNKNRKNK